jgi:flagellar biosynthetic protein FlhB
MAEGPDQESKTEEPTPKRLEDARKKGQVAHSREVNNWFMFLAGAVAAMLLGPWAARDLVRDTLAFFERPHAIAVGTVEELTGLMLVIAQSTAMIMLPLVLLFLGAAVAGSVMQSGVNFAPSQIAPKLERISFGSGFKRMFGARAIGEFLKGLVKMVAIGAAIWFAIIPDLRGLDRFILFEPAQLGGAMQAMTVTIMLATVASAALFAGADLIYQRVMHRRSLRMTREEIKEEYKEAEGDPIVKGRLKKLRADRARRRMMAEVPKASVVITNPTHFAVALSYDQQAMAAPKLVAKGADLVALRIREIAKENDVPIVENPPLARALHAHVDLDAEIPPEHYRAVAEVISYVMKIKGRVARPN